MGTIITILLLAGACLFAGKITYLAVKLTVSGLKGFCKRKNSKLLAVRVKKIIQESPRVSLDDLDDVDEDSIALAEYDIEQDELVQDLCIANDVSPTIVNTIDDNDGIVVFE